MGRGLFGSGRKRVNPLNPNIIRVGYGFSIIGFGSNRVDPNTTRPDPFARSRGGPDMSIGAPEVGAETMMLEGPTGSNPSSSRRRRRYPSRKVVASKDRHSL